MKNMALILRLVRRALPGVDTDALASEIRLRVGEELDYELEAANQREFAAAFRGHPCIVVPDVHESWCGSRVLVSDYVEGVGFEDLQRADDVVRNRAGEIVYRFFCGTLYRRHAFSGDPHPGNLLLQADGRIAFFDFGLFKRMSAPSVALELACQRAAAGQRAHELHRLMGERTSFPSPTASTPQTCSAVSTRRSAGTSSTRRCSSGPRWRRRR